MCKAAYIGELYKTRSLQSLQYKDGVDYVNIICSRWVVGAVSLEKKTITRKSIPGLFIKKEAKFVIFDACTIFGKRRRRQTNMKEFQVNDSCLKMKKKKKTKQTKVGSITNITRGTLEGFRKTCWNLRYQIKCSTISQLSHAVRFCRSQISAIS